MRLGSDVQGAQYLQEGLRRMPYSGYGWNALAVAQARQNQLSEALESLSQGELKTFGAVLDARLAD